MFIELDGPRIIVTTPAKVNLFLEVIAKLRNGYHEIDTLMCPISLCDKLIFEAKKDSNICFRIEFPANRSSIPDPAWEIPLDRSNLVVRAVEMVREKLNLSLGCDLTLVKSIPASAGMGGGSTDAAAAIVASMVGWGDWNRTLAEQIATELGSDIGFFLGDEHLGIGLAKCTGRGEIACVLPWQPKIYLTVCHPPTGCSTREVYGRSRITSKARTSEPMVRACQDASIDALGGELFNALQEPATQITEWIPLQIDYFKRIGARYCSMTGSGSACFALARTLPDAEEMACQMRGLGLPRAYAVESWYARPLEQQLSYIIAEQPLAEPA